MATLFAVGVVTGIVVTLLLVGLYGALVAASDADDLTQRRQEEGW